jgi:hypothetical protein
MGINLKITATIFIFCFSFLARADDRHDVKLFFKENPKAAASILDLDRVSTCIALNSFIDSDVAKQVTEKIIYLVDPIKRHEMTDKVFFYQDAFETRYDDMVKQAEVAECKNLNRSVLKAMDDGHL